MLAWLVSVHHARRLSLCLRELSFAVGAMVISASGCGTTKSHIATEQLVLSDAVDLTMSDLDFRPLAGKRVYIDTTQVSTVRPQTGQGLISSEYLIASVRERMLMSGCHISASRDDAELIVEIRVGALGTDGHSVMVGVPAIGSSNNSTEPNRQLLPTIPELSVARRDSLSGAAKVAVFAYDKNTRQAVWQSGLAQANSGANDTWILGVGPMQSGTVHGDMQLTASKKKSSNKSRVEEDQDKHRTPRTTSRK